MRYLAFQREAVDEIVSDRLLQSTDFEAGKLLAGFVSGGSTDISGIASRLKVTVGASGAGRVITKAGGQSRAFIVFDLEQSQLLGSQQSESEAVQCLQRVLRFAIKHWDQRVMNPSENVFPSYAKAVIFPFPISQKTGFRISIDLNPYAERLEKRGQSERFLLVYKAGKDDSQGPSETPSFTVFRKFLDDIRTIKSDAAAPSEQADISSFQNVSVGSPPGRLDIHQGYEAWMRVLTEDQRQFVEARMDSPMRIEGPAGTGKTLCLALKSIHDLREKRASGEEHKCLFVTHSEASRRSILTVLESMDGDTFINPETSPQELKVVTLQGLCAEILRQDISQTELLDPDAYDAKQLQLMYVEEALKEANTELSTYKRFLSEPFAAFLEGDDQWSVIQMLQHEIGVVIKGRSSEQFENYKNVPPLKNGIPISSEGDKAFVWKIYESYRSQLIASAQFDTDDVMLSALGQLSTPIWRRRRVREGYDSIFIDETHLFNMNELSVFHNLTKSAEQFRIGFAVDRSQAIGDRGWADDVDLATLVPDTDQREAAPKVRVSSVFRCSPEIVNLAFSVTSSGASLFTNFEDPLSIANSSLSFEEERMCRPPTYGDYTDDAAVIKGAFDEAEAMVKDMGSSRGDVAIIAFSDELFAGLLRKAEADNKPVEPLKERGNSEVVKRARQSGRFVLSMPDYVGGLEFNGAILVGVDDGRVPPSGSMSQESKAFLNFTAHNKLYVAITRARYQVRIIGVRPRGPSPILNTAFATKTLERGEHYK